MQFNYWRLEVARRHWDGLIRLRSLKTIWLPVNYYFVKMMKNPISEWLHHNLNNKIIKFESTQEDSLSWLLFNDSLYSFKFSDLKTISQLRNHQLICLTINQLHGTHWCWYNINRNSILSVFDLNYVKQIKI